MFSNLGKGEETYATVSEKNVSLLSLKRENVVWEHMMSRDVPSNSTWPTSNQVSGFLNSQKSCLE